MIDKCKNKKEEINYNAVEICMREVFTRSMIRMIGDYAKYATVIEDVPVFNIENFVANRPEKDASFYTELTETQLFNHFLQLDVKESFPYFYKTNEKQVNIITAANNLLSSNSNSTSKGKVRSNSNTGRRSTMSKTLVDETEVNYKDLILNSQLNELSLRNFSVYSGNDNSSFNDVNKANRDNLTLLDKIIYFENAETYVIPPYFLSSIIGFVDYTEIEKMIKGGDGQILGLEKRIFSNILDFQKLNYLDTGVNCISSDKSVKVNRYIIPDFKNKKRSQILTLDGPLAVDKFVMSNNIKNKISNFELRVEQGKKNRIFFKRSQTNSEQL